MFSNIQNKKHLPPALSTSSFCSQTFQILWGSFGSRHCHIWMYCRNHCYCHSLSPHLCPVSWYCRQEGENKQIIWLSTYNFHKNRRMISTVQALPYIHFIFTVLLDYLVPLWLRLGLEGKEKHKGWFMTNLWPSGSPFNATMKSHPNVHICKPSQSTIS